LVGLFIVRYAAENRINDGFFVHSLSLLLTRDAANRSAGPTWVRGGRLRPVRASRSRSDNDLRVLTDGVGSDSANQKPHDHLTKYVQTYSQIQHSVRILET